jgi:hypothetical protein
MENKIKSGRFITLGLLGTSMLVMLAVPSALAQTSNAVTTGQTTKQQQMRVENRDEKKPPLDLKDVTITVTYLDNGIKETFVSKTASVIAQMKQFVTRLNKVDEKKDETAKINVIAEATATGMVITTTSSDAEVAARIIGHAKIRELEKKLIDAKVDIKAAITRTVQETEKGVIVTISSDNPDVAQLIKLREKYPMEGQGPRPDMQPGNRPNLPPGRMFKGPNGKQGLPYLGPGSDNQKDASTQNSTL